MNEYLSNVIRYKSSLRIAQEWLKIGIISQSEYKKLETILSHRAGIFLDSIYRDISG